MKRLINFLKKALTVGKEAFVLVGIIIFVIFMFTIGSVVHSLRANPKFRRKCRKIWRAMQKAWQFVDNKLHISSKFEKMCQNIRKAMQKVRASIDSLAKKFKLEKGAEKTKKQEKAKRLKEKQKLNTVRKQIGQCEIFSGQARVIKREYRPSYIEVTFFTRREVYHKEKYITYIEYEGRKYKLIGKAQFMKFAEADVLQINGEKRYRGRGIREHIQIEQADLMVA